MQLLLRLRQRPAVAWLALTVALPLVATIRIALWALPFGRVWSAVERVARGRRVVSAGSVAPEQIIWAVSVASLFVPHASCLTQALAASLMLRRVGLTPHVQFGVARGKAGHEAHAWVELDGRIVIGGPRAFVARYTVLPSLPKDLP